jgi:hypothetical protein
VFGSWVRREAMADSDVDLLVVLDSSIPLARSMYRSWDRSPQSWDGLTVSPLLAHLPPAEGPVPPVWAEAAIEGVVLFDRRFRISRALARVRHSIAAGELVRRVVHGQPCWVGMGGGI